MKSRGNDLASGSYLISKDMAVANNNNKKSKKRKEKGKKGKEARQKKIGRNKVREENEDERLQTFSVEADIISDLSLRTAH